LPKLLVSVLADFLPFRSSKDLILGVVVAHDQHGGRRDVGIREIVLGSARVGDADLVDHGVVALGVQAGDQPVPFAFDELRLDAQAFGDGAADVHVKPGKLAGCVVESEGGVGAFGADLEHAGGLDLVQARLGVGGGQCGDLDEAGDEQRTEEFHGGAPGMAGITVESIRARNALRRSRTLTTGLFFHKA
jgi:hypothetical protein